MDKKNPPTEAVIHVPPFPAPPVLKQSCDTALQSAFHSQNWPVVVNLAKQRYKSTQDPYYLVSKVKFARVLLTWFSSATIYRLYNLRRSIRITNGHSIRSFGIVTAPGRVVVRSTT